MRTMIKSGLMFGNLSFFDLERLEQDDFSELMQKIEEYPHHEPGPNPVIACGTTSIVVLSVSCFQSFSYIHLFIIILCSSLPGMSLDKKSI